MKTDYLDIKTINLLQKKSKKSPFVAITPKYRIIILILIGLQLVIEFIEFLNSTNDATTLATLAALGQSIMLYLPILFYRPSYGWFHPLVFIPMYTFAFNLPIFVPKLFQLFTEGPASLIYVPITSVALKGMGQENLIRLNAYASLVTIISLGAYYLGFFLLPALKTPKLNLKPIKYIGLKTVITVVFSLLVFYIFINNHGGLSGHFAANWAGGRHSNLAGKYYWSFLINFGFVACLIWLGIDIKAWTKPVFWGCTVTSLLMRFLYGGSRSAVIYFLMIGLVIWMMRRGKFSLTKVIALILASILAIGLLGTFRNVIRDRGVADITTLTDIQAGITKAVGDDEEAGELTGARNGGPLPILARVPKQENYLYGSTYFAAITLFIPRAIWPDKPSLCGSRAAKTFYFDNADWGIPCGSIGEAYWNFGITGVCVVFFLYGYFHKWLAQSFRRYSGETGFMVLYGIALFYIRPDTTVIMKSVQLLIQAVILLYLWGGIRLFSRRVKKI